MPRMASPGLRALAARGDLPHGAFAGLTYADALEGRGPLLDQLADYRGLAPGRSAGPGCGPRP